MITFTLDSKYAIDINEVREIIDYPPTLMHPPGLPAHFKGVLNLRGDLVTIIDTRGLYAMSAIEARPGKVLVFKCQDVRYGLVVDSVDEILSYFDDEKMKLPDILYKNDNNQLLDDVKEAVEVGSAHARTSLLILNIESVYRRLTGGPAVAAAG